MPKIKHTHPKGLYILFFAEAWERLSYYGMRALLILYMTKKFGFDDAKAYLVYGSYTALVYATPLIGGYLADNLLGYRKAVVYGAVLMSIGHFLMSFENHQIFYLALATIVVGNGFFKPNISTIVGALYDKNDPRKDSGFTIFYIGINLGSFMQLIAGWLGEKGSWHLGFGFAGVGMCIGMLVFIWGRSKLEGKAEPPSLEKLKSTIAGVSLEWLTYVGGLALIALCWFLVQGELVGSILKVIGVLMAIILIGYGIAKCTREERNKLFAALILICFCMVFFAFFEQAGSSINLFTDRNVDRMIFGWEVPTTTFQSVNPGFIVLLAPLFSMMWIRLAERNREPSTAAKFGLGIIQLGLGFGALYYGALTAENGYSAMIWVILGYLLHTTGELCLSPIGLSMITKLSPKRIGALMMGTWFLAISLAQYVAALIAMLTGVKGEGGGEGAIPPATETVMVYGNVFGQVAIIAVIMGVVCLILSPFIRKLMQDVH